MITYGLMAILGGIVSFIFGLTPEVLNYGSEPVNTYTDIINGAALWSNWIPIQTIGQVATWVLAATVAFIGIKIVRLFISLITGGGGNV